MVAPEFPENLAALLESERRLVLRIVAELTGHPYEALHRHVAQVEAELQAQEAARP